MRIGLDGYPLVSARTGVGHYTLELAKALARLAPQHSFELIAPEAYPDEVVNQIDPIANLRAVSVKTNLITGRWWAIGLPRYVRSAGLVLFHGTNYEAPLGHRDRNVLTIHDLSIFSHRQTHENRIARRARRRLPIMLRNSARILTPTEAVKGELVNQFKVQPETITVTPEAPRNTFRPVPFADTVETRRRLNIGDDFILFVGTIEPRKNLVTVAQAFAEIIRHTEPCPQLVIAGARGWLTSELDGVLAEAQFGDRLRMIGYVGDDDLRALYSSCKLFVFPSLYEGFGLPPLEAMACGAPVIASRIAAHVETLGDKARLVEPTDARAWVEAIADILMHQDERERLAKFGLEHAARFSWERTANLTLEVYEDLVVS